MPTPFSHFGVIGAGAWGTALAATLKRPGSSVTLWAHEHDLAQTMAKTHENALYLPGVRLEAGISFTSELADVVKCDALILAVPAQHMRSICQALHPLLQKARPLVIAAKGIEQTTHRLMSEVVAETIPSCPLFVLSGPSFAHEVARGLPAALTLAGESGGETLAQALSGPSFRLYTTDDIIGTQIGGAIKNVLAIACGVVAGRKMGENARAALITRGLAEIMRLGQALGAKSETLMGLSGLGDLVLTCSSQQSRNMSLGFALGEGQKLEDILARRNNVTEGIMTAAAALGLAYRHGVDMPVVSAIDRILRDGASIDDCISALLARPLRNEAA